MSKASRTRRRKHRQKPSQVTAVTRPTGADPTDVRIIRGLTTLADAVAYQSAAGITDQLTTFRNVIADISAQTGVDVDVFLASLKMPEAADFDDDEPDAIEKICVKVTKDHRISNFEGHDLSLLAEAVGDGDVVIFIPDGTPVDKILRKGVLMVEGQRPASKYMVEIEPEEGRDLLLSLYEDQQVSVDWLESPSDRIGFWSESGWEIKLYPEWRAANKQAVIKLTKAMRSGERGRMYRGYSPCRVCDNMKNGMCDRYHNGVTYPDGLPHYLSHGWVPPRWIWDHFGVNPGAALPGEPEWEGVTQHGKTSSDEPPQSEAKPERDLFAEAVALICRAMIKSGQIQASDLL